MNNMVGCFELSSKRPFEAVFQSLSGRLPEREEEGKDRQEKKCPNNPHLHPLQAQQAHALLLSKLVGPPGTGSFTQNHRTT